MFTPELGGRFPMWRSYFSDGLVQPPTIVCKIDFPKQHLQEVQLADWHYNTASRGHTREISSAEKGGFCERRICTTWHNNLGEMETFIYTIYYSSSEKLDHDNIGEITGRGPPCRCRIFRSRRLEAPEHVERTLLRLAKDPLFLRVFLKQRFFGQVAIHNRWNMASWCLH